MIRSIYRSEARAAVMGALVCASAVTADEFIHDEQSISAGLDADFTVDVVGGSVSLVEAHVQSRQWAWARLFTACTGVTCPSCPIIASVGTTDADHADASQVLFDAVAGTNAPYSASLFASVSDTAGNCPNALSGSEILLDEIGGSISSDFSYRTLHIGSEDYTGDAYGAAVADLRNKHTVEYEFSGVDFDVNLDVTLTADGASDWVDTWAWCAVPPAVREFPPPASNWDQPPLIGSRALVRMVVDATSGGATTRDVYYGGFSLTAGFVTNVSGFIADGPAPIETSGPVDCAGTTIGIDRSGIILPVTTQPVPITLSYDSPDSITVTLETYSYSPALPSLPGFEEAAGFGAAGAAGSPTLGDANGDGLMNQADRNEIANSVGTSLTGSPATFNPAMDLDGDFVIGSGDLALFDAMFCPCEYDGIVGTIDVFDLLAFMDVWQPLNGTAVAPAGIDPDYDNDGLVNISDLTAFLSCYFAASSGCP